MGEAAARADAFSVSVLLFILRNHTMLKKFIAFAVMLYAAASFAAVDVNKATAADLDSVKGIGPAISGKIVEERKKGNFKDWNDFITRVQGVGEGNAAKLSEGGLTINGSGFKGAAAVAAPAKKEDKPMAKSEEKKGDAKPMATAAAPAAKPDMKADAKPEAKADPKAEAKAKKEADKKAKADEKMKKAEEAKAKKDAKPAAADAAKPAASAAKK
jgi:competence protein ComEA